jgi:hypothetical protein
LKSLSTVWKHIDSLKMNDISLMAENCLKTAKIFSFKRYLERIQNEILKLK